MNSRDKILARLNKVPVENMRSPVPVRDRDIYLDYPPENLSLADVFKERLTALQGEVLFTHSRQQAADYLYQILKEFPPKSSLVQQSPVLADIISAKTELKSCIDDSFALGSDSISFSQYACGITTADCLIARTGSVLLTSRSAGGRRLSVLPPVHVVIAAEQQIVPSLDDAFKLLKEPVFDCSYAVVITGPSRTSDIEKQLVLGAHGPKRLVVIILRS
jgi:L-lactate dehydrogenase complex protein LldG